MNLKIGSHILRDIQIPLLWGNRAIVQEPSNMLSVIDIGGFTPTLEILRNQPAPGIGFIPTLSGFQVLRSPDIYEFNVREKAFSTPTLGLPDVQIDEVYIRVGAEVYPNLGAIEPVGVLHVSSDQINVGMPIPYSLFRLLEGRSKVA